VALLSAAGVVLAFAMVNRVVLGMLLNQGMAGPGSLWRDWGLGGAAVGLAVTELALLAALRLAFGS
jgi:hypothetical protein